MFKDTEIRPTCFLILVIIIYLVLLLPTVGLYGIYYDEQTDMDIARSYISEPSGWLNGSSSDPANVRLPMYFVAIIFTMFKTESLFAARLVSCFMGVLILVGVYVYCKRQHDRKTGIIACLILATSPYFLSFSRVALTESDIFIACALVWLLVCLTILREKRTVGWAGVSAVVLGLALSSKISAVSVIPAVLLALLFSEDQNIPRDKYASPKNIVIIASLIFLLAASIVAGWGLAYFSQTLNYSDWRFKLCHYLLILFCWITILSYVWVCRHIYMKPLMLSSLVIILGILTFLVIPPVHTTNPSILLSLTKTRLVQYSNPSISFVPEAAALHFLSILFKSSLIIGAFLWLSFFIAVFQSRYKSKFRLPLLIFLCYFLFLLKLPFAQTFYMMPLLPILAILAADQFIVLFRRKSSYSILLGIIAISSLTIDMFLCYPDYNLNGYQWLGERYLAGKSTIGYRSIVQTTTDGIEQCLEWANKNIPSGKIAVAYVRAPHIVRAVSPNPKFQIVNGFSGPESILMDADYVIIGIDYIIRQGFGNDNPSGDIYQYPYDTKFLNTHFTKVFFVKRAFGIEVASVWRRIR